MARFRQRALGRLRASKASRGRIRRRQPSRRKPAWRQGRANSTMRRMMSFRDFDWMLLLAVLVLCAISLAEIYSTTVHTRFALFEHKQMIFIGAGLVGMFVVSKIDYHRLLDWAPWMYWV